MKPVWTRATPSPALVRACAVFGVMPRAATTADPAAAALTRRARQLLALIREHDPRITLISGPSGSGKSRLLARVALEARRAGFRVFQVSGARLAREPSLSMFDLLARTVNRSGGPAHSVPLEDHVARLLARFGLADPTLWPCPACDLSEGQRWRLAFALAAAGAPAGGDFTSSATSATTAPPGALVVCDEFTSPLDRVTAMGLCATLSRRQTPRLLLATPHDDVTPWLRPDLLVRLAEHAAGAGWPSGSTQVVLHSTELAQAAPGGAA
ncbi:MAG: AAA family ATPase [Planctomycetota bacterium]|nr:AAA family ATPase [Planctomycetota bacterium]